MKIFVIGSGGREHAIVWKLKQTPKVKEIYCSPGNGGISQISVLVPDWPSPDWSSYVKFVKDKKIDFTFVGPEAPLAAGIVDRFRQEGLRIFGPTRSAAQLESSKIYAKEFMIRNSIPTARFKKFDKPQSALDFMEKLPDGFHFPLVIKADGLAAGKGVSVCAEYEEARDAIEKMMLQSIFGKAGSSILIEECLQGREVSLMAFCDSRSIRCLIPARDYKRAWDGDRGPNTGGMGSIAPAALTLEEGQQIEERVARPFLDGVRKEELDFRGIIYFGIMMTSLGPYVLEFNVRFGDPETQVVLPLLKSDLTEICEAVIEQKLESIKPEYFEEVCLSVVCASGGYPQKFDNHKEIFGLEELSKEGELYTFHAGTLLEGNKFYTNGGRVLNIVARQKDLKQARLKCYNNISKVYFDGIQYRKDIGKDFTAH